MWVRGLKRDHVDAILWILPRSHPMWVRGLKHSLSIRLRCNHIVAPYVGAWIETSYGHRLLDALSESHPMWVRGLKQVGNTARFAGR